MDGEVRITVRFPDEVNSRIEDQLSEQRGRITRLSKNTFIVELVRAGLGMKLQAGFVPLNEGGASIESKVDASPLATDAPRDHSGGGSKMADKGSA